MSDSLKKTNIFFMIKGNPLFLLIYTYTCQLNADFISAGTWNLSRLVEVNFVMYQKSFKYQSTCSFLHFHFHYLSALFYLPLNKDWESFFFLTLLIQAFLALCYCLFETLHETLHGYRQEAKDPVQK